MVRKTALVTAMLGAFASQAFAMGLGDIRLNSVLNQPLHAEIELLSPTAADIAELRVGLASNEAYNRAGIERAFFHTKLRFEVVNRADGTAAIKITSREPVREPYLDFLLEATWASGQVLREYTVLVDPPVLMPAPKPTTQAPVASAPVSGKSAAASAAQPVVPRPSGLVEGEYRTSRNDTLWRIASSVRPDDSVSTEQAMLALLKTNPDAFYEQNINNLLAGRILRVPSREEMVALDAADALNEVRRQNRAWRDGRAAAGPTEVAGVMDATPVTGASAQAAEASPEPQLKLLAPETGAATGSVDGTADADLRRELTLASEAVEAQRLENQELQARLKQLEDQNAQLHRLLELKDSTLSQLSGTAAPADGAVAAVDAQPQSDVTATFDAEGAPGSDAMFASPGVDSPVAPTAADDETAPETEALGSAVPEPIAAPALDVPVVAATPVAEPNMAVPERAETSSGGLFGDAMFQWGAMGAGLLAVVLAWAGLRRRRAANGEFQESILAERGTAVPQAAQAMTAAVATGATASAAESVVAAAPAKEAAHSDSSLFTDFAVSDMGALQNDAEADPVAEADVYLAYGRYQQAEELIRGALQRGPERNDLRLKLLEVLFAAKNVAGFETEAEALLAALGAQDNELWQRVAEMGQELNPTSPLYRADGAAVPPVAETPAAIPMAEAELFAESANAALDVAAAPVEMDNSLDFDMGELASFVPHKEQAPQAAPDEDFSFDLTGADTDDDAGDGVLASSDEVATKLDLARAYIEMGDPDGARSILGEVLQEGGSAHKAEAESLLQQVG